MTTGVDFDHDLRIDSGPLLRISVDKPPRSSLEPLVEDLLGIYEMLVVAWRFADPALLPDELFPLDAAEIADTCQTIQSEWDPPRVEVVRLRYGSPWFVIIDTMLPSAGAYVLCALMQRLTEMVEVCAKRASVGTPWEAARRAVVDKEDPSDESVPSQSFRTSAAYLEARDAIEIETARMFLEQLNSDSSDVENLRSVRKFVRIAFDGITINFNYGEEIL